MRIPAISNGLHSIVLAIISSFVIIVLIHVLFACVFPTVNCSGLIPLHMDVVTSFNTQK